MSKLEPLRYNSYVIQNSNIITDTVTQQFISLGITQVKHLSEIKSYELRFRFKQIFESLKREITEPYLSHHWEHALYTSSCLETDAVIKYVTDIEISSKESKLVCFRSPAKKDFTCLV